MSKEILKVLTEIKEILKHGVEVLEKEPESDLDDGVSDDEEEVRVPKKKIRTKVEVLSDGEDDKVQTKVPTKIVFSKATFKENNETAIQGSQVDRLHSTELSDKQRDSDSKRPDNVSNNVRPEHSVGNKDGASGGSSGSDSVQPVRDGTKVPNSRH